MICPCAPQKGKRPMTDPRPVAALFVLPDSVYKSLPGVDCYDEARDARTFPGGMPVVAHPPCRLWGSLSYFSKADPSERKLAMWAACKIAKWGGVLEHPRGSKLWKTLGLPAPNEPGDPSRGFTLDVDQYWWGHRAQKRTWLYVVGCRRKDLPPMPIRLGRAPRVVTNSHKANHPGHPGYRPRITNRERQATPPAFAAWLVEVARRCRQTGGR